MSNKKLTGLGLAFATAALSAGMMAPAFASPNGPEAKADQLDLQYTDKFFGVTDTAAHTKAATKETKEGGVPLIVPPSREEKKADEAEKTDEDNRIIRLDAEVDSDLVRKLEAQLIKLDGKDATKPITMHISSPGGSVVDGLSLYDTMKSIHAPVYTICDDFCASMAAVLLSAGEPGHRTAAPSSTVMIHQLSGGVRGKYNEIASQTKFIDRLERNLVTIMAEASGHSYNDMNALIDTDKYYSADEAKQVGLIDSVTKPLHQPPHPLPKP